MKLRVLEYLVCPACQGDLHCHSAVERDGEIEEGTLECQSCYLSYPIRRGIPRMLSGTLEPDKERTADAFGWEWQEFNELHNDWSTYEAQFLDWIAPLDRGFFRDKVVLDAGCGMGRFAASAGRFGAKDVLAIDLSDAVESARRTTRGMDNVHVIQADIYRLPFRQPFDFAFSIGVLHHLPDPEGGFRALVRHTKDGGNVFGWVYGRENNGWIVYGANPLREYVFSRLPRKVLYGLSLGITAAMQPVLKTVFAPLPDGSPQPCGARLPYNGYLSWLAQYGFRHNHHVIFDHMVAPTAFYLRREEFEAWFRRAGLEDVQLSWRNENSWRGLGRKPVIARQLEPVHADSRA